MPCLALLPITSLTSHFVTLHNLLPSFNTVPYYSPATIEIEHFEVLIQESYKLQARTPP